MSKLQRLRDNIAALTHCFTATEYDHDVLSKYTGFGGLSFVLNPLDTAAWAKSDLDCFCDTIMLQQLLKDHSKDEREFRAWMQSVKESTLTAYYTPRALVRGIEKAICKSFNPDFDYILDPAAGTGAFLNLGGSSKKTVAYEKDLLTGLLLSRGMYGHWGNMEVRTAGFETIPTSELGKYDLVATNVPFGNISVFDPLYTNSINPARREAAKMIHRYYVLKGLDCLKNGGIEAYIITSNYLNRDSEQLREALKSSRLIGAYRLANNLFIEAGTEVGTDLLVLQKQEGRTELTPDESMLLTAYEDNGCPTNLYFTCYPDHVIATSWTVDTDPYGKRAFIYMHRDGVKGIAEDLSKVLSIDMKNVDVDLFSRNNVITESRNNEEREKRHTAREKAMLQIAEVYKALYESEAKEQVEHADERQELNRLYDTFIKDYGELPEIQVEPESLPEETLTNITQWLGGVIKEISASKLEKTVEY